MKLAFLFPWLLVSTVRGRPSNGPSEDLMRRLGLAIQAKNELTDMLAAKGDSKASAQAFSVPKSDHVFFNADGEREQCDSCGSEGSCYRKTPLGERFDVAIDVENELPDPQFLVAYCLAPELASPDCVYAPNNEVPKYVTTLDDLYEKHVESCEVKNGNRCW